MNDTLERVVDIKRVSVHLHKFLNESELPLQVRTSFDITSEKERAIEEKLLALKVYLLSSHKGKCGPDRVLAGSPGQVVKYLIDHNNSSDDILTDIFDVVEECVDLIGGDATI
jgi:hypothetical protein